MRHTTVHYRFQIGCSYCGYLVSYSKLSDALADAKLRTVKHNTPDEEILVTDIMAHQGCPEEWDADGKVRQIRGQEAVNCLELRERGASYCSFHPFSQPVIDQFKPTEKYNPASAMHEADSKLPLPTEGQSRCAFLRDGKCYIVDHNKAVKRAFDAGINREPLPSELLPCNYRLPCEVVPNGQA